MELSEASEILRRFFGGISGAGGGILSQIELPTSRFRSLSRSMQIEKLEENGEVTLKLVGEIDLHASPVLRKELQERIAEKTPMLLIDFTGVEYIDSSGLATFIEYMRDCAAFEGKLALFGLKTKVRTIFDLVRLNELFVIADSAEAARAALATK